ncbi:MAG: metallophosphoesterase [Acidobacteria bacterium]|nr:metallophosphoesterase [Acidobacteriota bacterium]
MNRFMQARGEPNPLRRIRVRRRPPLRGSALGTLGFCTRWAVDRHGTGPEWLEVTEVGLRLHRLPQGLRGLRIAQISDLHCSNTVSGPYLARCIERINRLDPDLVVLTGDYITYDLHGRYRSKVTSLLGRLRSRGGVYACLGNHDYGMNLPARQRPLLLRRLTDGMQQSGIRILRNESAQVDVGGQPLWLVGLGDLWPGDFFPRRAFEQVPAGETALALVHNPRGADRMEGFGASAVLSGHTHGSLVAHRSRPPWRARRRPYSAGLYEVGGTQLYVNRGLGRIGRARLGARPEITVFTLR